MVLLLLTCRPSVNPISPPSPPSPPVCSETPPSTYHSLPPAPSPSPAPAHPSPPLPARPKRSRCPRDEWLPEQWSIPDCYKQPREPTPAVESSDDDSSDSDDPLDLIQAGADSTPEPTSFMCLSNALMQICGRRLVRKRWRLNDSMALGRLSSCHLGSVQLAPDGS